MEELEKEKAEFAELVCYANEWLTKLEGDIENISEGYNELKAENEKLKVFEGEIIRAVAGLRG